MDRAAYTREIARRLGRRKLVYFGTRGADARTLVDVPNFECAFSQIAPMGNSFVDEVCLETIIGRRVDLDVYNIDQDSSAAVEEIRDALLSALREDSAVLPYRSCALLASAWFPRSERALFLGNFHEHQACFEHKPWVETQLAAAGVETVPWRYFGDREREYILEMLSERALVVRANRSDGGSGVRFVRSAADLESQWPEHSDGFLAVAPLIEGPSINANAVVFPDGLVSHHGISVQLIGTPGCTDRHFGYCGNDFATASELPAETLSSIEAMVSRVGSWLACRGYLGAFGVDAILSRGRVFLVEVNPRFQGSSRLASRLDARFDRADMFLAHMGAFLGLGRPDTQSCAEVARRPVGAHVVIHASASRVARRPSPQPSVGEVDLVPEDRVMLDRGAIEVDLVFGEAITTDGRELAPIGRLAVEAWHSHE